MINIPPVEDRLYLHFMKLVITLADGRTIVFRNLEQDLLVLSDPNPEYGLVAGSHKCVVTKFDLNLSSVQEYGYDVQKGLFKAYSKHSEISTKRLLLIVLVLAVACAVMVTIRSGWRGVDLTVLSAVAILIATVLGRVLYYALVDASFFAITVQRHLFVAIVAFMPVMVVVCDLLVQEAWAGVWAIAQKVRDWPGKARS